MNRKVAMALFAVLVLSMGTGAGSRAAETEYLALQLGGVMLNRLELALTPPARTRGLMQREHLAADAGMVFVFPQEEILSFWMKHTRVALDLIYVNNQAEIVSIHTMAVEPAQRENESLAAYEQRLRNYSSGKPASVAIELKAGLAEILQLRPGDRLLLDVEALKARCH